MKKLTISLHNVVNNSFFRDHAVADIAYNKIKDAMAQYREFGNERSSTVEVVLENGATTLKLGNLQAVILTDLNDADRETVFELHKADHEFDKRCRKEFGKPKATASKRRTRKKP